MQRMSYFRSLSATLLSAAISFSLVSASGCGTSAIGVDDCRDIEQARCRAGKSCGIVDDVEACERYYRDHCLHGLPAKLQAGASAAACVEVIEAAGRCAAADPTIALSDCSEPVPSSKRGLTKACDVVLHPERAADCDFLSDLPDEGSAGQSAGGQSGADPDEGSDASAGQAAQGGAAAE
jgi:hypothetical protein